MAGSYLTPKIVHSKGDWFLGYRLPEFKTTWHDPQGRPHHLEITGRYMRCDEHDNPIMQGIIHVQNPNGAFSLSCLELRSHWPRIFTSGPEFLNLHSEYRKSSPQNKFLGELKIEKSSVNKARMHVLATMLYNLGSRLATSTGYAGVNSHTLALAAYALENLPQLGLSRKLDGSDAVDHLEHQKLYYEYWGYRDDVLESKVRNWHIDNTWCQPTPSVETGPSLAL